MQAMLEAYIVWYDTTTSVIRKARILTIKKCSISPAIGTLPDYLSR